MSKSDLTNNIFLAPDGTVFTARDKRDGKPIQTAQEWYAEWASQQKVLPTPLISTLE